VQKEAINYLGIEGWPSESDESAVETILHQKKESDRPSARNHPVPPPDRIANKSVPIPPKKKRSGKRRVRGETTRKKKHFQLGGSLGGNKRYFQKKR